MGAGLAAMFAAVIGLIGVQPAPRDYGTLQPGTEVAPPATSASRSAGNATNNAAIGENASPAGPASLSLPTLRVQAMVEKVRTTDGILAVPDNPAHVGWWIGSALPGAERGTVVLDGHVDSAGSGPGALFRLVELGTGDPILLTTTRQQSLRYAVVSRRVLNKQNPLPPELFTASGPPRLVVITCGGKFDRRSGSYEDNIVVIAVPTLTG